MLIKNTSSSSLYDPTIYRALSLNFLLCENNLPASRTPGQQIYRTITMCKNAEAPRCCSALKKPFHCGCWAPERFVLALLFASSHSYTLSGSSFLEAVVENRLCSYVLDHRTFVKGAIYY